MSRILRRGLRPLGIIGRQSDHRPIRASGQNAFLFDKVDYLNLSTFER